MFSRSAIVDRFDGNWIYEVAGHPRSAAERAIGVVLDREGDPPPGFPEIRRARGNRIEYTDVGIELRGAATRLGARHPLIDFGRGDDPGDNIVRCNGTERGASVPGYDVHVALDSDGSGALLLAGNLWDHAVPRVVRGTGANGTELVVAPGAAPAIVLTAARQSSSACGYEARPP